MKVINLLNMKGGVAKTFTAVNMAYELWRRGCKVLVWDNDKQGNLSRAYRRYDAESISPTAKILKGEWEGQERLQKGEDAKLEKQRDSCKKGSKRSVQEQVEDTYIKSMQEWLEKNAGDITRTAGDAIRIVFDSNTPQKSWSKIEWTVFTAKAIMQRADCVSREDLRSPKQIHHKKVGHILNGQFLLPGQLCIGRIV